MPPSTDAEAQAARVGPVAELNGPIHLAEYDPGWPDRFRELATRIRGILGPRVLRLEHVGSTSVPGLAAKPIIDLVMEVEDSTAEASYVPPLEHAGFVLRVREPDWYEHRMLKTPDFPGNLHVFSLGCEEVATMLRFRDWLRQCDEDRLLYEQTKRELAARTWKYTQNYADAKSDVVRAILGRARA